MSGDYYLIDVVDDRIVMQCDSVERALEEAVERQKEMPEQTEWAIAKIIQDFRVETKTVIKGFTGPHAYESTDAAPAV